MLFLKSTKILLCCTALSIVYLTQGLENNPFCTVAEAKADQGPSIISDDETEAALEGWLKELFEVAGISISPRVYLLNTPEINAGATYGGVIIINTGFLIKCKNVSQVLGVLAHETGHIAGGHLAKASAIMRDSSAPAVASILIGGAASLLTGNPGALLAGFAGGAHIFERSMLRHSREQEDSADASALTYLNKKKWPVAGLAEFHEMLGNHYTTGHEDPYVQTHPLPADRKEKIILFQKQQPQGYQVPAAYEEQFQRIKAKLYGYLKTPLDVRRDYPLSNTSISARYARLISAYVSGKSSQKAQEALVKLDELLAELPGDPYFLEMKGQFLFETGQIKQAIPFLRQACEKRPKATSIKLMYAHALIEATPEGAKNDEHLQLAVEQLTHVVEQRQDNTLAWRLLGTAYGRKGETANASACLAEEAFQQGKMEEATSHATKGKKAKNISLAKRSEDILQQIKLADDTRPAR